MTLRLTALVLAVAALAPARAQELRPTDERVSTAPGYFTYFLPGERTSQVSVLGTVRAPGFYLVSAGTDLSELLALAGGPNLEATSPDFERTVTIRLYRATNGLSRELLYERTAEAFTRDAEGYPIVVDGDMLEVTTFERARWGWRDSLTVAGGAATVVIAVIQIVNTLR
ncbi:MAG TPA: SLBB domain-containing protein [Rubricoccaceae bacterium]